MSTITQLKSKTSVYCPLCESEELQTLATRCRDSGDLHTAICTGCGLVFTSPIPMAEEIDAYYAKDYRLLYKGVRQPKLKHIHRAGKVALTRLSLIQDLASAGANILDIGSGGGEFVYLLQSRGYSAFGIEPDEGYGNYSIQEYGIDVRIGPFSRQEIEPDSLDIITAHHVVEHLRDPLSVFRGAHAGLREDGHFIVEVPNVESHYHTPSNKWHFAHIFNYNVNTLENLGQQTGFQIVTTELVSSRQHLRTIFRKTFDTPAVNFSPENYHRVKQSLDRYTDWHHFTSMMPANRLYSALSRIINEKIKVNRALRGKEILDQLYGNTTPLSQHRHVA